MTAANLTDISNIFKRLEYAYFLSRGSAIDELIQFLDKRTHMIDGVQRAEQRLNPEHPARVLMLYINDTGRSKSPNNTMLAMLEYYQPQNGSETSTVSVRSSYNKKCITYCWRVEELPLILIDVFGESNIEWLLYRAETIPDTMDADALPAE